LTRMGEEVLLMPIMPLMPVPGEMPGLSTPRCGERLSSTPAPTPVSSSFASRLRGLSARPLGTEAFIVRPKRSSRSGELLSRRGLPLFGELCR